MTQEFPNMCGGYLLVFFNMKKQYMLIKKYLIFYYRGYSIDIDLLRNSWVIFEINSKQLI